MEGKAKSYRKFKRQNNTNKRLEEIKKQDTEPYKGSKETVDLFLNNFNKKDKGDLD